MKIFINRSIAIFAAPFFILAICVFFMRIGIFPDLETSNSWLSTILFVGILLTIFPIVQMAEGLRNFFFISYKESYLILLAIYLGCMGATILLQRKYPKLDHILFSLFGFLVTIGIFVILYLQFGNS